jgi:hypothetical protein
VEYFKGKREVALETLVRITFGTFMRLQFAGSGPMAIGITSPEWTAWGRKRIAFPPRRTACATASEGIGGVNHQSGNRAFDDYRAETLRRLEDEQREFKEFLKRLRVARDRAEFDQFMNDRHIDAPSASRGAI